MPTNGGRTGPDYLALRRWVIASFDDCHLCGKPVNKNLSGRHPLGPTLDHLTPISRGGSMLSRTNARLAHRRCNMSKGDTPTAQPNAEPSRNWLN